MDTNLGNGDLIIHLKESEEEEEREGEGLEVLYYRSCLLGFIGS